LPFIFLPGGALFEFQPPSFSHLLIDATVAAFDLLVGAMVKTHFAKR
jgi:hypothetical protein